MGSPSNEEGRESDEELHEVTLTKGFWLSKFEITQSQWEAIVGDKPSWHESEDLPVKQVSCDDIQDFLIELNANTVGATYRLPTEAEWEYACRAGSTTRFYWGDDKDESEIGIYAWYSGNTTTTHPVGQKEPNAFGLYDMTGNVQEWCQDTYGPYPPWPVTDPTGPETFGYRVLRGGAFVDNDNATWFRSADRYRLPPINRVSYIGLRLVRNRD